jgi:hypothetical protein
MGDIHPSGPCLGRGPLDGSADNDKVQPCSKKRVRCSGTKLVGLGEIMASVLHLVSLDSRRELTAECAAEGHHHVRQRQQKATNKKQRMNGCSHDGAQNKSYCGKLRQDDCLTEVRPVVSRHMTNASASSPDRHAETHFADAGRREGAHSKLMIAILSTSVYWQS